MNRGTKSTVAVTSNDGPVSKPEDPIQKAMGSLGKWQIWICAVIFLLKFPVAWHQMSIIFLAPKRDFTCENETISNCSSECDGHVFDSTVFQNTIVDEWDLVCDRAQLANISQTLFMLGILVGNMFFGTLADKFGRRGPLVFAVILQLIAGVAASFSPWFWMFVFLRFLSAVATGGTMVVSFVLVMELIGVKWRELFSVLYQVPFNLGHLTLPAFAYFFRDWHSLQFALSIPSVLLISYYWLIPESPRWLLTVGKVEESAEILIKAAKINNLPHENIHRDLNIVQANKIGSPVSKGNIVDLFRTPNMRAKTFCICFNWFVCGLAFFGVAQYIGHAGGNIFSNVAISAGLELPGTIVCIYLNKAFGRKKTLIFSNTLCGVAMLIIAFIPAGNNTALITLASIGIIGMSISFPTVYLYGGELFPTVVRNVGVGTCSMVARFGSMLAPFVAGLSTSIFWLPPVIFGVVPLIGSICVCFLPETQGFELPDTIEDGENFGKSKPKNVESGKF